MGWYLCRTLLIWNGTYVVLLVQQVCYDMSGNMDGMVSTCDMTGENDNEYI